MDWKQIVGTVAPWLGTALGGPLGGLAVSAVADALGLSDKTEDAIRQALGGATPEQMLAIKAADQQFATRMQELGFANQQALAKIAADDRDSARRMAIADGGCTRRNLAYVIVGAALACGAGILFAKVQADSTLAGVVIGYLSNEAGAASAFFFGEAKTKFSPKEGAPL
ncbi:hypothetical protein [Chitiniphilus shinanonensis]|uniref:hypothetical protein n=1 Tax=Chitiniphilus shinanonensis TaxID=553088 RepID=UPI00302D8B3F